MTTPNIWNLKILRYNDEKVSLQQGVVHSLLPPFLVGT